MNLQHIATASRLANIEAFHVMELAKQAAELERAGRHIIHMGIGEPDFTAAAPVVHAAEAAMRRGVTQYTGALGIHALREAIAGHYKTAYGLDIPERRVIVTAGASGALLLACAVLVEIGAEVLMPDPSYPCNRHFVAAADGVARLLPASPAQRFQPDAPAVEAAWTPATRGVLLASPSNPTGTSIAFDEMARIVDAVRRRGGFTIVDEIYLGLSFDAAFGRSALAHGNDVISINSFSKYFSMTGWRLGWLVLPPELVAPVERLAQNLYICPSSVAQQAALACFEPESIAEYERRRSEFRARRDFLVPALESLGLRVPVMPDGAFCAWADCSAHADSSWDFCFRVMREAQVAITPGRDFGPHAADRYVRFSYANSMEQLRDAVHRLQQLLSVSR